MKRNLLLIGVILFCNQCYSWDLSGIAGSRGKATGNCSVPLAIFGAFRTTPPEWRIILSSAAVFLTKTAFY